MKTIQAKIWYFRNEWTLCRCPYNKKATRNNRIALIKEIFNL